MDSKVLLITVSLLFYIFSGYAKELLPLKGIQINSTHIETQDTTRYREPNEPPNIDSIRFDIQLTRNYERVTTDSLKKILEKILDDNLMMVQSIERNKKCEMMNTDFLNISEEIENYRHHVVKLIYRFDLTEEEGNVKMGVNYGLCQASFRSRYWNYKEIPDRVREQVKKRWVKKLIGELPK